MHKAGLKMKRQRPLLSDSPVNSNSFTVQERLRCAPAEPHKLRVTKHWVQILQQPALSFRIFTHTHAQYHDTFILRLHYLSKV